MSSHPKVEQCILRFTWWNKWKQFFTKFKLSVQGEKEGWGLAEFENIFDVDKFVNRGYQIKFTL